MILPFTERSRLNGPVSCPGAREQGMAVIVVLALVSIMLIYIACNIRTIANLGRELKLLEQRQTRRLETKLGTTNAPVVIHLSHGIPGAR
jgi:hypothetical protein